MSQYQYVKAQGYERTISAHALARLEAMAGVMPAVAAKPLRAALANYSGVLGLHRDARAQLALASETLEAATEAAIDHIVKGVSHGTRAVEAATSQHLAAVATLERATVSEALTAGAIHVAAKHLNDHRWGPSGFIWCATQRANAGAGGVVTDIIHEIARLNGLIVQVPDECKQPDAMGRVAGGVYQLRGLAAPVPAPYAYPRTPQNEITAVAAVGSSSSFTMNVPLNAEDARLEHTARVHAATVHYWAMCALAEGYHTALGGPHVRITALWAERHALIGKYSAALTNA